MNRAYVALLLAALSWGLALTTADAALAEISATDLLLLETAAGTAVVVVACWVTRRRVAGAWRPAVVLGSLEPGIAYVFANVGLILTSAAVGSMLFALESVFVVALAAVLLRSRPRRIEITALVLGVLGTMMVALSQSGGRSSGMGVGIMVVSTLISAGYVLATKRFAGGHEPVALVARQGIASLIVTFPFILGASLNGGTRLGTASAGAILLACLTGVIGFSIPYTLWTTSLPHVRAGFAAVALNLVPLVGVISATALGQGQLSAGQWTGGGFILFGLILLTRAEMKAPAETSEPIESSPAPVTNPAPTRVPAPVPVEPTAPSRPLIPGLPVPRPAVPRPVVPRPAVPRPAVPRVTVLRPAVPGPTNPIPRARPTLVPAGRPRPTAPVVPVVPAQRRPEIASRTIPAIGLPRPRASEPSLPVRIRVVADAGLRTLREGLEGEPRRLRPGRAGQPVPSPWQRDVARSDATAGDRSSARSERATQAGLDQSHESLVRWLREQRDVDNAVDVEAIAVILTGAITHYQSITDGQENHPFGIEEGRYLTAVADLAAASLAR